MIQSNLFRSDQQTRCSLLTGAGRSAIAVLEVNGPRAAACLKACIRFASDNPLVPGQVRYGRWIGAPLASTVVTDGNLPDVSTAESIVVIPQSDQRFEVHCHGGPAAVARLIEDLHSFGVVRSPPDVTSGVPNGAIDQEDPLVREAIDVLSRCTTTGSTAIVLDQVRGAMKQWRDQARRRLAADADQGRAIATEAERIARAGEVGVRLNRPFDVVLAGPPNVGKSSLINAMVGYDRSIVMDLPGTTRDILDAETVFDGWAIRLRDTAGVHPRGEKIEREGIDRAIQAVAEADLVVRVTQPAGVGPTAFDSMLDSIGDARPVIRVLNKSDLGGNRSAADRDFQTVATSGQGVDELLRHIVALLTETVPPPGSPVPLTERQMNWLREVAAAADIATLRTLLAG